MNVNSFQVMTKVDELVTLAVSNNFPAATRGDAQEDSTAKAVGARGGDDDDDVFRNAKNESQNQRKHILVWDWRLDGEDRAHRWVPKVKEARDNPLVHNQKKKRVQMLRDSP